MPKQYTLPAGDAERAITKSTQWRALMGTVEVLARLSGFASTIDLLVYLLSKSHERVGFSYVAVVTPDVVEAAEIRAKG